MFFFCFCKSMKEIIIYGLIKIHFTLSSNCFMLNAQVHVVHWIGHVCNVLKKIIKQKKGCPRKN